MGCRCSKQEINEQNEIISDRSQQNETKTNDNVLKANLKLETNECRANTRASTKYMITVETSEPQNLDPTQVYYVEDKNPQPKKLAVFKEEQKILRTPTIDVQLTEKIQNGESLEDILSDPKFQKFMKK
jgi:hypothetical protein